MGLSKIHQTATNTDTKNKWKKYLETFNPNFSNIHIYVSDMDFRSWWHGNEERKMSGEYYSENCRCFFNCFRDIEYINLLEHLYMK